jgi:hypothetical protein
MNIPNFENVQFTQGGYLTEMWQLILQNLITELQTGVGQEGFEISNVSSDPNSVSPPTTGGQLAIIQATATKNNGVTPGTVIFDPYEINGGSGMFPRLGQLKVLLNDGMFHGITNT